MFRAVHQLRRSGVIAACVCVVLSCGGPTAVETPVLTTVTVALSASTIEVGQTATASATGKDQNGASIGVGTVTWSVGSTSIATVSAGGIVTAVGQGQTTVIATAGGKQGSANITIQPASPADYSIAGAQFTQGVQVGDGSIPMVLSGNPAVVNVLVRTPTVRSASMQIALRIFDATGALIRTDTALTQGSLGPSPTYAAPTVQFLVPSSVLKGGLTWQVVRDPKQILKDDTLSNDVFPRTGTSSLSTVSVPPLNIRFVPIVLAAHSNATGAISTATIPQYLRTARSVHPLGVVNAYVGTPLTTNANFGTGGSVFWQQVLSELDLARMADPAEREANWYGIVVPPSGVTNTDFGGFSYIPPNGTASGERTRTSASVQIGWFFNQTQARDLVGHELGHTFGRLHAPCGGAGNPLDLSYPVPGGTLEQSGHDVYAWANGLTSSAATVPVSTGDVMGYCFPVWASAHTYKGILAFRGSTVVVASPRRDPITRVLVVRGSITNGNYIALEPTFAIKARPYLPERPGEYRLDGLDSTGTLLFSYAFEPSALDHAPNIRPFAIALPSNSDLEDRLASIVVRGPAGLGRLDRPVMPAAAAAAALRETSVERAPTGTLTVSCAAGSARGILVLNETTGSVFGSAAQGSMRLIAAPGTALSVICSDGVRTERTTLVAP